MQQENEKNTQTINEENEHDKSSEPTLTPLPPPTLGTRLMFPFIIAVFIYITTALIFTMIDMRIAALMAGIFLTVSGIIALLNIKITHKTWEIILLPVIGVPLTIIPVYLLLSEHFPEKFQPLSEITKLMFWGILALVAGLGMLVIAIASRMQRKKRCTVEVEAECVDYVMLRSRGIQFYRAVWKYTANGQERRNMDKVSSLKRKPALGYKQMIMIDPTDPDEFYRREETGYIMFIVMGISLMFAGFIILSSVLK